MAKFFGARTSHPYCNSYVFQPDFDYKAGSGDQTVLYTHRKVGNGDVYFFRIKKEDYEELQCKFRVKNKQPEFWDAVTGNRIKASVYKIEGDHVIVRFQLDPYGSTFVVFRDKPWSPHLHLVEKDNKAILGDLNLSTKKVALPVVESFTISFWVKPEINILLDPVLNQDSSDRFGPIIMQSILSRAISFLVMGMQPLD